MISGTLVGLALCLTCWSTGIFAAPLPEPWPQQRMAVGSGPPKLPPPPASFPKPFEVNEELKPHSEKTHNPMMPPVFPDTHLDGMQFLPNPGSGDFPASVKLPPPPDMRKENLPPIDVLNNEYFRTVLAEMDGSSELSSGDESKFPADVQADDLYTVGSSLSIKSPIEANEKIPHGLPVKGNDDISSENELNFPVPNLPKLYPPNVKPMRPVKIKVATGEADGNGNITTIRITYTPFLTIPDGLTQAEWDYEGEHPHRYNPFKYETQSLSDDCYVISKLSGLYITTDKLWQIRVIDDNKKIIMSRICVPTSKFILQPGYTIEVVYIDAISFK